MIDDASPGLICVPTLPAGIRRSMPDFGPIACLDRQSIKATDDQPNVAALWRILPVPGDGTVDVVAAADRVQRAFAQIARQLRVA
jgi:hypothetical protein